MKLRSLGLALSLLLGCSESGGAPKNDTAPDTSQNVGPDTSQDVVPDTTGPSDTDTSTPDTVAPDIDPGRVVYRRLNRTEYRNTVRDLFGPIADLIDPAHDLPADDLGYGFDNIASVLTLSPLHLELYERAARLLTEAATTPPLTAPVSLFIEGEHAASTVEWGDPIDGAYFMGSGGDLSGAIDVPRTGRYTFELRAWETPAGPDRAQLALWVSGIMVGVVSLTPQPAVYTLEVELQAGRNTLAVEFLNDYWDPSVDPPADRNAVVDRFGLVGPDTLDDYATTPWAQLVQCRPEALRPDDRTCATNTVSRFARLAWRRPASAADLERLMALYDDAIAEGSAAHEALALPLQAALLSPRFIFKIETDRQDTTRLDGYELATRLAYFLWSTTPDETLLSAAANGELDTTPGIQAQVRRMLADPKSRALTTDFAGQWLYIRDVANIIPDPWAFPEFDESLRLAMTEELIRFFRTFVETDRSLIELVTASDTWVNRRLAEHYRLENDPQAPANDATWTAINAARVGRAGILSKAGLLAALSTPFRTSVVRRGKWTLGQLLCSEPSPPPPGVEGLLNTGSAANAKTLREKMELHKTEERCKTCHVAMDGIGYALEHFDGLGAWRDTDNGEPIDATGVLRGNAYDGPVELAAVVAADRRLPECYVEKVLIYAIGRGLTGEDQPLIDRIVHDFSNRGHRFRDLIELVATSEAFTHRRPEVAP